MSVSDWIALATLAVFILQLIVLVLGYFGIIKETNRNARERQKAIDDVGEKAQEWVTMSTAQLVRKAKQERIALLVLGLIGCLQYFIYLADKYRIVERFKEPKP